MSPLRARFVALAAAALALLPAAVLAVDKDNPFAVSAKPPSGAVAPGASAEISIQYDVFKDHFIYRDMSDVKVLESAGLNVGAGEFPKGQVKFDKVSEMEREIYPQSFAVKVPVKVPADAAPGRHEVKLNAKWQGCNKPENFCLFPANLDLVVSVEVVGKTGESDAATGGASPAAAAGTPAGESPAAGPPLEAGAAPGARGGHAATLAAPSTPSAPGSVTAATLAADVSASPSCAGRAASSGASGGMVERVLSWLRGASKGAGSGPGLLFLLLVFVGGLGSSLTPCVYPMIPITISVIGASADQGRLKAFGLSLVYVAGICATYTLLGFFAASTGGMFGAALQNPWVLIGVAVVMLALSAAMFGLYEFALPESVTTRASQVGGGGWAGAFIVGTVAGVVAAPCTGPVVAYLLLEIANHPEWSSTAGVLVMLAYSLGLGMLFLAIGTFAGILASLPRSGTWMLAVKQLFGTVLVGAALFYFDKALASAYGGRHLIPEAWNISVLVGWGAVALSLSIIVAGGRALLGAGRSVPRMMAGAGVAALSLVLLRPEAHAGVIWVRDHLEGLSAARAAGRPAIVDFTADWCAACKELEHFTYTDPAVVQCAAEFVPIMVDGTRESAEFDALRKEYGFKGLPAVYFVCPDGRVVRDLTLRGFEPADRFLAKMNVALATCREGSLASARPGEQPS